MQIVMLRRDEKGHAALLEGVCERVMSFAYRFQGKGHALVDQIWKGFSARDPAMGIWAILNDEGKMVGHSVAGVIPWSGEWVGWSYQTEIDEWATPKVYDGFCASLEAWVKAWNEHAVKSGRQDMLVSELYMFTPNDAKVMARHTGFAPNGTILSRRIK